MMQTKIIYFKVVFIVAILLGFGLLFAGCHLPGFLSISSFDSEEVIAQKATIAMRMTETQLSVDLPTGTPMPTAVPPTEEVQCTFVWTLKQDDDLSILFTTEMDENLRNIADLGVVWYGENCINSETNALDRFYASNLDNTFQFKVVDEITREWLGQQIKIAMDGVENGLTRRPDLAEYPIVMHFVYEFEGRFTYLDFDLEKYRQINGVAQMTGEDLYFVLFE